MPKHIKSTKKKIGMAPGTLIHVGERLSEEVKISLIKYCQDSFTTEILNDFSSIEYSPSETSTSWVNVDGLHDIKLIEQVGNKFNIHPLTLEDVLNTTQRPKIDFDDKYIYVVLKMLYYNNELREIRSEQVSLIIFKKYLFSFQEFEGDVFDDLRKRLQKNKSNIRSKGTDYLAYSLLDSIIDSYFDILENIGTTIDDVEDKLLSNPDKAIMPEIYNLKREMILLRNSVWPLREILGSLIKSDNSIVEDKTLMYLRDIYDHTIQVMDIIETYRDILSGMLDTYLSSISNKTNDVMKILTIFSTIFIPLTFLAGIYGMNFDYMPELRLKYGYILFWVITLITIIFMVNYFKKKKWF